MKNLFLFSVAFLFLFSSCEKEDSKPHTLVETNIQPLEKANNDCILDDFTSAIRFFEFCGTEYIFQVSLELLNVNQFHRIQAIGRCYKRGGDPNNLVDFAEIEAIVSGKMHIGCGLMFDILEPSVYNENLVNGNVPFRNHCDDCGKSSVTIDYYKDVTLLDDDFIKANFRIKMQGCGEWSEEFITLVL